jgi:GR25 family glycosyltransferase involved in LPS biosynthesis
MPTYQKLIQQFKPDAGSGPPRDFIHATLAAFPGRLHELQLVVDSLVGQVDTLHVYLNEFSIVPEFLERDKIFITRSQDFGMLGECGKYYWTDDLPGYHLICSDRLVYPPDYAGTMISKIEQYQRKCVIGTGGYQVQLPFVNFKESAIFFPETGEIPNDTTVPLISDLALAYHSSTLHVSRHFFYQPELSDVWFSIIGLEQEVPFTCASHIAGWLQITGIPRTDQPVAPAGIDYRTFLVKSWFVPKVPEQPAVKSLDINDCFDRIYVMNLDRRNDRWERMQRVAESYHLNLTRFPAVDRSLEPHRKAWESYAGEPLQQLPEGIEPLADYKDKFLKYHHYIARVHFMETKLNRKAIQSPGALGYSLSYIRILEDAIGHDYQRILILDDDLVLHKSFNFEFEKHFENLPEDWKIIKLGTMQHQWEPWITPGDAMFYHCHGSSIGSFAVGISGKVFLPLLFYAGKFDLPVDEGAVFHIQNVYSRNCFIFMPNLAIADLSESDIGSSAMKPQDLEKWQKLCRWNPEEYDYMEKLDRK